MLYFVCTIMMIIWFIPSLSFWWWFFSRRGSKFSSTVNLKSRASLNSHQQFSSLLSLFCPNTTSKQSKKKEKKNQKTTYDTKTYNRCGSKYYVWTTYKRIKINIYFKGYIWLPFRHLYLIKQPNESTPIDPISGW